MAGSCVDCLRAPFIAHGAHVRIQRPTAGSGKSLLVDIVAVIATGSRAPVFSQGRDETEMEKRVSGALLCGYSVVSIDNCTLPIAGDLMCQALTQTILSIRPLGKSPPRTVPTSCTFFATGNSLVIAGDMTRRVLLCSLDPRQERPESRHFDFDPLKRAETGRAGYLADALTILRAYHLAGRPKQPVKALGNFEAWSDFVRGALLWLEIDDPVRTMDSTREMNPKLAELRAVLTGWFSVFGQQPVRVREVIVSATDVVAGSIGAKQQLVRPDFCEALMAVASVGNFLNSRALGQWLSSNRGQIVGAMCLLHMGTDRDGIAKWKVEKTESL